MNQQEFGETTKQILFVITKSVIVGVPIDESYLKLIATRILPQSDTVFLRPLVDSMRQHPLAFICLHALPGGDAPDIANYFGRNSVEDLLLQPLCAGSLNNVVHIDVILEGGRQPYAKLNL